MPFQVLIEVPSEVLFGFGVPLLEDPLKYLLESPAKSSLEPPLKFGVLNVILLEAGPDLDLSLRIATSILPACPY